MKRMKLNWKPPTDPEPIRVIGGFQFQPDHHFHQHWASSGRASSNGHDPRCSHPDCVVRHIMES